MKPLLLIIKREFFTKIRNRSFIIMTFLSPLLLVVGTLLIVYLTQSNQGEIKKIAIWDRNEFFHTDDLKDNSKYQYINISDLDLEQAKKEYQENYNALIYVPQTKTITELTSKIEYISDDSPSIGFISDLEHLIETKITKYQIEVSGIDYRIIENAKVQASIQLAKSTGESSVKGLKEIKIWIGAALGYFIMMFIITYGNFVMRSVIEEKSNRIIEIIVSSVKPFHLMLGKILGNSFAGLLQFVIWVVVGVILFVVISNFFELQPTNDTTTLAMGSEISKVVQTEMAKGSQVQLYITELLNLPLLTLFISFLIYFAGGYFLYSSVYAAIGAAVDNETDSQQFMMPILVPLMLAVYIGFFTVIDDPHGSTAVVFSIIPFTSPIVMLMRIPFGVPVWQLTASIVLLFATFLFVVWSASKIYRVGILMYGKKPSWKDMYKWLRY